jgi:hypothetical protein
MVSDHYFSLGFQWQGGGWVLDMQTYEHRPTTIRRIE